MSLSGFDFVAIVVLIIAIAAWLGFRFLQACEAARMADWGHPWANRIAGFISLFCRYVHGFEFEPIPLPATGHALVASNHISGLDPFLLIAASSRPLRFLIAREEYHRFGLNWLFRLAHCIPVDREKQPERAMRAALRALEAGDVVAVFPHGRIHLDADPPRKLKGGIVRLAHKANCPIYPARLDDVRGAGHTVAAVFVPSSAKLRPLPVLHCGKLSHAECLAELASLLEPGAPLK